MQDEQQQQKKLGKGMGRLKGGKNSRRKCPFCDSDFGQDRALLRHVKKDHANGFVELSLEHTYVSAFCGGHWPECMCGCGTVLPFRNWRAGFANVIRGHNGNLVAVYGEKKAAEIVEKRRKKLIGSVGWSRGLTKETSPALARAAKTRSKTVKAQFDSGERVPWSKGLTKETDERLAKHSQQLKEEFASGKRVPWMKGLTKDTDERVAKISQKISKKLNDPDLKSRLSELKKLKPKVIEGRLKSIDHNFVLLTPLKQYTGIFHHNMKFQCQRCGDIQTRSIDSAINGQCFVCGTFGSIAQTEIINFIKDLDIEVSVNDRTKISPQELDIFVPSRNFAIEYNSLFFHSEYCHKDKHYHKNKTASCALQGIQLFHIFEDEWRDKRPIVESMIKHKLGLSPKRIAARKCKIATIDSKARREFFQRNHIDGDVKASHAIALITPDGSIAACMSIRTPHHKRYREAKMLEVARFCSTLNTVVPGALGRITKAARQYAHGRGFKKLMTYVDERHGTGMSYNSASWQFSGHTGGESFWWTNFKDRFNRFAYRADKKRGMTQKEIAIEAGVHMIWGCKNKIYMIDC